MKTVRSKVKNRVKNIILKTFKPQIPGNYVSFDEDDNDLENVIIDGYFDLKEMINSLTQLVLTYENTKSTKLGKE